MVDLDDIIPKSKDLIGSNQSPKSWIGSLVNACITNQEKTRQQTTNGLY
jgi:hypothetical protein